MKSQDINTYEVAPDSSSLSAIKLQREGIKKVIDNLIRFGLYDLSLEERINYFKSLNFEDFMRFLVHLRKSYSSELENRKASFSSIKKDYLEKEREISFFLDNGLCLTFKLIGKC